MHAYIHARVCVCVCVHTQIIYVLNINLQPNCTEYHLKVERVV